LEARSLREQKRYNKHAKMRIKDANVQESTTQHPQKSNNAFVNQRNLTKKRITSA